MSTLKVNNIQTAGGGSNSTPPATSTAQPQQNNGNVPDWAK